MNVPRGLRKSTDTLPSARLLEIINSGPMKTFSWMRLKQLDFCFHFHRLLNETKEIESTQMDDPKDFSNSTFIAYFQDPFVPQLHILYVCAIYNSTSRQG